MSKAPPRLSGRNGLVAIGLVGFAGLCASLPLALRKLQEDRNLFQKEQGLTGSQIMRGAYMNSGSKDVGADPDYDHQHGTWHGKRNDPYSGR